MEPTESVVKPVKSFYKTPSPARFTGIGSWLLTIDHKRIGLMYMASVMVWFVIALIL
ncbi:MAG: hypothetical protein HQK73_09675, partial [Desulfamplus sp.]|nr:hypothetical protein [Desulfamplus sp.]